MSTGFFNKLIKIVSIDKKTYILNQIWCFICLMIYTSSSVIFPSFLSKIVDIGIMYNNTQTIFRYSIQMLFCGILMIIFYYLQKVSFFKFGNKIILNTKQKLYDKLNNVNIMFWNKHKVGDILTILDSDISKMQDLLTTNISEFIVNIFLCIGIGAYIIILNVKIGISVIILAIFFALFQRKISNKSKEKMRLLRSTIGDFNSYTTETISNLPALQMAGKSKYIKNIHNNKCKSFAFKSLDFTKTISIVSVTGMLFNILAIILVLSIGAVDVENNLISVGLLFSLTIYVQRLYSPIISLGNIFVQIKNFVPILDNIYDVMFTTDTIINGYYKPNKPLAGKIEFKNVWYTYDGQNYVLKNFSESINIGEVIGIIGENGSGKTTISRLLTKLCAASKGTLEIDGININDIDTDYLQSQVGVMSQDSFILINEFNDILKNKEQLGRMHKYLEKMNFSDAGSCIIHKDLETENKLNISGGEAQKLALYNLYLDNKPICILDEPTASLDSISESKIIHFIKDFSQGKTVIIITHKQNILQICTRIINLDEKLNQEDLL